MRTTALADGSDASSPFGERWRWLGHLPFLCAVFLLALNDHVLKSRYPGWWTGKLSDFAGVAVVATLAAVLLGASRGTAVAGIGFLLLKMVPGVAEASAPFLGGVPRRDPSDLVALLILVPWWFLLRPLAPASGRVLATSGRRMTAREIILKCRAGIAATLPIAGALIAVTSASATSCAPRPAVTEVRSAGQSLYAIVSHGWQDPKWARSDDGGRSWTKSAALPGGESIQRSQDPYEDPGPSGPLEVGTAEGTRWRLRDRRIIERQTPGGGWVQEFHLSDSEFTAISTGCRGGHVGVLGSIAVIDAEETPQVIASLGADGVLVRQKEGDWTRQGVLSAAPRQANTTGRGATLALLFFGPVLALALGLAGRRWLPSWRTGLAVTGLGWFGTIMVSGAIDFMAGSERDPTLFIARIMIAGMVVTTGTAIIVSRRPRRSRPLPPHPMPPPPMPS